MKIISLASIAASQFFLPHSTKRIPENASVGDSAVMDGDENVMDFNRIAETNVAISLHGMLEVIQRIGCNEREFAVDLACGPGHFTIMLARELGFKKVIGIDLSEKMLKCARNNAKAAGLEDRISFISGDVTQMDAQSLGSKPDLVTCTNSAHHLPTIAHVRTMVEQIESLVGDNGFAAIMDLVRLNTERAIELYVSCFGKEYLQAGLNSLYEDFRNSMHAAWSVDELKSCGTDKWQHVYLKPIPINQFLLLRPKGGRICLDALQTKIPPRFMREYKTYARLLVNALRPHQ